MNLMFALNPRHLGFRDIRDKKVCSASGYGSRRNVSKGLQGVEV